MASFRPLVIALLLLGIFAVAIVSFGINLARENGATQNIGDNPIISNYAGNVSDTLGRAYDNANDSIESLSKSPVTLTGGFPLFDAIAGLWKVLKTVPITVYNLTVGLLLSTILGSTYAIVLGVVGAIFIITIIFAVWKMLSTGQGG